MTKTTEQWEALLDGITPAPWRWYWDYGIIALEGADTMPVATDLHVHDSDLLAAAPEAVAEVIRLRKAIAELADEERVTAEDEFYPVLLRVLCRAHADDLTRILEGEE